MNVEVGTDAAQFPEKEYINGIFVAVWLSDAPANRLHLNHYLSICSYLFLNCADTSYVYFVNFYNFNVSMLKNWKQLA